jgi:SAM-dependent methyltransferase
MTPLELYRHYDPLAWFYNRHWGDRYHGQVLPVLDRLILSDLSADARLLDLCCGAGHLTQALAGRGYQVTGLDGSAEMLRYARENAPGAEFIWADARTFSSPPSFHAALSTFDSLNHILKLEELRRVFQNVHGALLPGGVFVFDLNMEEAYRTQWRKSSTIVETDHIFIVQGGYQPDEQLGRTEVVILRGLADDQWRRSDLLLWQRCYSRAEVESALGQVGFEPVQAFDARRDLAMADDLAVGRTFFSFRKRGTVRPKARGG